jgi:hypothetical protein
MPEYTTKNCEAVELKGAHNEQNNTPKQQSHALLFRGFPSQMGFKRRYKNPNRKIKSTRLQTSLSMTAFISKPIMKKTTMSPTRKITRVVNMVSS